MFIVKRKEEILRFGLFLLLTGLMAYFVTTRFGMWRSSRSDGRPQATANPAAIRVPGANQTSPAPLATDGAGFFAQFRVDREQQRSARREELTDMVNNPNIDPGVRKASAEELGQVQRMAALEVQAETMIRAKGYPDALVVLSDGNAQVIVKATGLTPQNNMQVLDTVSRITGVKAAAIQVSVKDR